MKEKEQPSYKWDRIGGRAAIYTVYSSGEMNDTVKQANLLYTYM